MTDLGVYSANLLWRANSAAGYRRWRAAANAVEAAQRDRLQRLISANANTEFGREHGFTSMSNVDDFRARVPIRTYEDFSPYIDSIAEGRPRVLTHEPVTHFAVTSGSTSASKLIPYTKSLVNEFRGGIDPWAHRLLSDRPALMRGKTYWSVTPVAGSRRRSAGGIPIGFEDERDYFDPVTGWVLKQTMTAPAQLAQIEDMDIWRYLTLKLLLAERSLTWMSIWSPTFLTTLLSAIGPCKEMLIADIRHGGVSIGKDITGYGSTQPDRRRADELQALLRDDITSFETIWPRIKLISCWGHGSAASTLPGLRSLFPNVHIQPKGLLATEGFISFPWEDDQSALSLESHFFEFVDADDDTDATHLAHELRVGKTYSVIISTSGGFYRYRIGDLVEVGGHYRGCPLLRFVGREGRIVDLCGEKLNEAFVDAAVTSALAGVDFEFAMLAPVDQANVAGYALYLRATRSPRHLAKTLDTALSANFHYNYARRLGQLQCVRIFLIDPNCNPQHIFLDRQVEAGRRLGDVKPEVLSSLKDWAEVFPGRFSDEVVIAANE